MAEWLLVPHVRHVRPLRTVLTCLASAPHTRVVVLMSQDNPAHLHHAAKVIGWEWRAAVVRMLYVCSTVHGMLAVGGVVRWMALRLQSSSLKANLNTNTGILTAALYVTAGE